VIISILDVKMRSKEIMMQKIFENSMVRLDFDPIDRDYLVDQLYARNNAEFGQFVPRTNHWDEDDREIYDDELGFRFTR